MTTFDYNYQNSLRFCFVIEICQSRWGLKNNSPNLHKKTTNWRILVVVVKWCHRAIVLFRFRLLNFGSDDGTGNCRFVIMEFETEYWRRSPLIDSRRSGMYQSYNFLTRLGMQSLYVFGFIRLFDEVRAELVRDISRSLRFLWFIL